MDRLQQLLHTLSDFRDNRNWKSLHNAKNLSESIVIESAELLECFQWGRQIEEAEVVNELADVLTYCLYLCLDLHVDPIQIVESKLKITSQKYPERS